MAKGKRSRKKMTTNITIQAHCSDDKEVIVTLIQGHEKEHTTLQDGESHEVAVFDDRLVTVKESPK